MFALGAGLVEAFYPNPSETDQDPVATDQDVQNALNGMAKGVIDQEWWETGRRNAYTDGGACETYRLFQYLRRSVS